MLLFPAWLCFGASATTPLLQWSNISVCSVSHPTTVRLTIIQIHICISNHMSEEKERECWPSCQCPVLASLVCHILGNTRPPHRCLPPWEPSDHLPAGWQVTQWQGEGCWANAAASDDFLLITSSSQMACAQMLPLSSVTSHASWNWLEDHRWSTSEESSCRMTRHKLQGVIVQHLSQLQLSPQYRCMHSHSKPLWLQCTTSRGCRTSVRNSYKMNC